MNRYRIGWRDAADIVDAPEFHLTRDLPCRLSVRNFAAALVVAGSAVGGELSISLLDGAGRATLTVHTAADLVGGWVAAEELPRAAETSWSAHVRAAHAAIPAVELIRDAMRTATMAGAVALPVAMRLVGEAERLLDPEADEE